MARCVALALLAIVGGAAAGGYGAPETPEPPPPAEPYGDEVIAVDPPPPPEPEPTEPPPPPPTEPPPPPPTEPPPPPPTEPPMEPEPEPVDEGYAADPPAPPPTEPPPPPPTEPPPPPPTEPPPPPPTEAPEPEPAPADEEPGYSDALPMDTMIDDVALTEVATYGSVAPDGRKVLKKFRRTFKLSKPSLRDLRLPLRPPSKCRNARKNCQFWAQMGECNNQETMRRMRDPVNGCGRACGVCTPNRQEWRLRRHNAGVLRRRLAAKGRRVVFKKRRAANN